MPAHNVLQVETGRGFTDIKFTNEPRVVGCTVAIIAIHKINAKTVMLAWL